MSSLLHAASRIQAAVNAYNSVQDWADQEKWRAQFVKENVCPLLGPVFMCFCNLISVSKKHKSMLAFHQAKADHPSHEAPNLHPLVVALVIVLTKNEDFSLITENHPELKRHKYYNPSAVFPPDLSPFLPPREDRWWEDLGASLSFHLSPFLTQRQSYNSGVSPRADASGNCGF